MAIGVTCGEKGGKKGEKGKKKKKKGKGKGGEKGRKRGGSHCKNCIFLGACAQCFKKISRPMTHIFFFNF